jgi:hypothetical protein
MSLERSSTSNGGCGSGLAQVFTWLFALLTVLVIVLYVFIFVNPYHPINPFPPYAALLTPIATEAAVAEGTTVLPTFTPPATFPPTWTPTLTPIPTETFTPRPTATRRPPRATSTPIPLPMQFATREPPIKTRQLLYGAAAAGWWTGVAGEVSDEDGNPVTDVTIRVWDDRGHSWQTTPGRAADYARVFGDSLGGGGSFAWWEQVLDGGCQQSFTVHVQVLSGGQPASDPVTTQTSGSCDRNLILIFFVKRY